MKNLMPVLITLLSALGLTLSACTLPEDQGVGATTTGIGATATNEATRETIEEATAVPETPRIKATGNCSPCQLAKP
jgi:hypothetical protein